MRREIKYIAERGEERVTGNIHEIAQWLNMTLKHVYNTVALCRTTKAGWRIRRYSVDQWIYTASHPDEDEIVGSCEEVACLLGVSKQGVALTGRNAATNRKGWTIRREKITVML